MTAQDRNMDSGDRFTIKAAKPIAPKFLGGEKIKSYRGYQIFKDSSKFLIGGYMEKFDDVVAAERFIDNLPDLN